MVFPRLGLVPSPSPLEPAPPLAVALGADALWLKRDDLLPALHGGTKVRKLDVMLATEPWRSASGWVVSGAVGSGQVSATVAAGLHLGRPVHAHLFRTPLGPHGTENLAYTASYATTIRAYRGRIDLALRGAAVLLAAQTSQGAVIPPGATAVTGMLGTVLGGMELAEQLRGLDADALYLAFGSGGTAVGVAMGLALAGVDLPVRAVSVVEHLLAPDVRVRQLVVQLTRALRAAGMSPRPPRLAIVRGHVGAGYALPNAASIRWAAELGAVGVAGEPVYTGKAMAGLAADIAAGRTRRPVFWVTVRRDGLPCLPDWESRLPALLQGIGGATSRRREEGGEPGRTAASVASVDSAPRAPSPASAASAASAASPASPASSAERAYTGTDPSRRIVLAGLAAAVALVGTVRLTGYDGVASENLTAVERAVVRAAGEALFTDASAEALDSLPDAVDRYVTTFPDSLRLEVHALLYAVEHNVALAGGIHRFTTATPADRLAALQRVSRLGGPGMLVARSMRDLVLVAWWQRPESWAEIGYEGPMVDTSVRPTLYDALRAPKGWSP